MSRQLQSTLLVGTALALVMAVPAYAQQTRNIVARAMDPWSGFYVGVGKSLDLARGSLSGYGEDQYCNKGCETVSLGDQIDFFARGVDVEFALGFRQRADNGLVIGGEANIGLRFNPLRASHTVMDTYTAKDASTFNTQLDFFGEIHGTASFVAKIGAQVTPTSLFYGLAGITFARYRIGGSFNPDCCGGPFSWSQTGHTSGVTLGVGWEKLLGPRTSFQLEYRFTNLGAVSTEYYGGGSQYGTTSFDPDLHQVLGKLVFRFAP